MVEFGGGIGLMEGCWSSLPVAALATEVGQGGT